MLVKTEEEAIAFAQAYLAYHARELRRAPPARRRRAPPKASGKPLDEIIPADENKAFDMMAVIDEIIDEGSLLEIKKLFAKEIITGFARIDGRAVGIVANQPKWLGGVLFVGLAPTRPRGSSGCATRSTCRCSTWPTCPAS